MSNPKKILIVEDDPATREILSIALECEGHAVLKAPTAADALAAWKRTPPDLTLLDLRLPDFSGVEVLKSIRSKNRLAPVIVVTASVDPEDKTAAVEAGATDFIRKPFDMKELTTRVRSLLNFKFLMDELEHAEEALLSLSESIDARDRYAEGHNTRILRYSTLLARRIKLGSRELEALKKGAIFHDIGKIAVREDILSKSGRLTPQEFKHVQIHPLEGKRLLERMTSFAEAVPIVLYHHEKLDGSGYPHGLTAGLIPVPVRIVSIADVYDALTTDKPYRKAFSWKEAVGILQEEAAKGWWDKDLVAEFGDLLQSLPENAR